MPFLFDLRTKFNIVVYILSQYTNASKWVKWRIITLWRMADSGLEKTVRRMTQAAVFGFPVFFFPSGGTTPEGSGAARSGAGVQSPGGFARGGAADLNMEQGIVSRRVTLLLRSTEIKPLFSDLFLIYFLEKFKTFSSI